MYFRRASLLLPLLLLIVTTLFSQDPVPAPNSDTPVFKSNVQVVLVDVVATNSQGQPAVGLNKEDFEVLEDGKPQVVTSFEEHGGAPSASPKLPPNVFTNSPTTAAADSVNVLLLDTLNTPLIEQSQIRAQMLKYLKNARPGTRLAIFTLGSRLRFIQGFTSDVSILIAAMENQKTGAGPQSSQLLRSGTESAAEQQAVDQLQSLAASVNSPAVKESAEALKKFLGENAAGQTDLRIRDTLQYLEQLGRYLAGVPGRKNVIWFTGAFPPVIFEGSDVRKYDAEIKKTADLLTAARVAIYPIGAEGLATDGLMEASTNYPSSRNDGLSNSQYQSQQMQRGSTERNANHATMDQLAKDSGGEALYNTNGLDDALAKVINHGTHYYTLTYTPADKGIDGAYHHIQVKLKQGSSTLAYRRGYYAENAKQAEAETKSTSDPLRPFMDHGTPDSTQILYQMKLLPSIHQPASGADRAGDNAKLSGPVTRYTATFTIAVENLGLQQEPDGAHHANLEMALVGYDRDGNSLNWLVRALEIKLPVERYALAQKSGVSLSLDIDLPERSIYLRSGVYGSASGKAGTLEVPLSAVNTAITATK